MAADKAADRQEVRFKLIYQILISMLVISLVPLGGLWYISIHKAKQEWTTNIRQNLVNNTEHLTRSVDEWTAMNLRLLEQNASTPAVLGMEAAAQNRVMKSITDVYNWIYLAFTVSPDGQNPGRSDGKTPTFYGDRDYVKQVLAGKPFGQQVLLGKTSNKPAFILAKPIKGDAGNVVGVMAIAMTLEDLSKSITKTRIGETGFALLLDEQNRLIAHGRGEVTSELQDFSAHPALKRSGRPDPDSFVFVEGDKKIVADRKSVV